jgi:hypothetical protein
MATKSPPLPFNFKVRMKIDLLKEVLAPPLELTRGGNAIFRWYDDHLQVNTVDGPRVMKVRQRVPKEEFEYYNLDAQNGAFPIGVPCSRIGDLLDAVEADEDEVVELEYNQDKDKIDMSVANTQHSLAKVARSKITEPQESDLEHTFKLLAHKRVFDQAYRIIGTITDTCSITVGEGEANLDGSHDLDDSHVDLSVSTSAEDYDPDDTDIVVLEGSGTATTQYDINMIGILRKFLPEKHFRLHFQSEYPLYIEADRLEGAIETEISLAPRV